MALIVVFLLVCSGCSNSEQSEKKFYAALQRDDVAGMKRYLNDVELDGRAPDGRRYIHSAVVHGSMKAAQYLWRQQLTLTKTERYELLLFTMQAQQTKFLTTIVKRQSVMNATNQEGQTALLSAVQLRRSEYVDLLLQRGANANRANRTGETFAHVIAQYATVAEVERWAKYVDDWNVRMKNGDTPFMSAVRQQNKQLLPTLMKLGAEATLANKQGETALHIAVQYNDRQLVGQLLEQKWQLSTEAKAALFNLATVSGGAALKQLLLQHRQSL